MSDRTCPSCNIEFKFPSKLKRHFESSYHCKKTDEEITDYFNDTDDIDNIIKCNSCLKTFTRKSSYIRHQNTSKCRRQENSTILESLTPDQIKIITNIIKQKPNTSNNDTTVNNTINNIINNNNNNNSNNTIINNNITNNNTIIQHINPFGFEDVRTIPISEMKTILTSGTEAGLEIIKTIYNKIENKNFYKPNISKPEIACLNKDFNLTIYKSREFCDALFDRCITFLHHMLYLCKNEYTKNNIKYIYDNIEHIETTMRTEIYDKKLKNIIETEFINNNINNKDRIKKFIKEIKDNVDTKNNSLLQIKNTTSLKEDKNNEYKISITNIELNNIFGDPKIILGLKKDEIILNLRISRFEESIFYNFWIDRIKNIKTYVMKHKKATIGDIANLKKEENKIMSMLELINKRVENNRGDDYLHLDVDDEFRLDDVVQENEDIVEDDLDFRNIRNLHTFNNLVSG
jgi:hypothetical protein